jgi:acetyl esterase
VAETTIEIARATLSIPTRDGPLPIELYRAPGEGALPVMVYFPGGGFVYRFPDQYAALCARLAATCRCAVAYVDYRRAPAHPFPAAPKDCYAALGWIHAAAADLNVDPRRIVVAGDSAGAALATVACLMAREYGGPPVSFQILTYPFVGGDAETPSRRTLGPVDDFVACWRAYTPGPGDAAHPYASPLNAPDLSGLPPALVVTGEKDALRDEGEVLVERLRAAGSDVTNVRIPGAVHGFLTSSKGEREAGETLRLIAAEWRKRFG